MSININLIIKNINYKNNNNKLIFNYKSQNNKNNNYKINKIKFYNMNKLYNKKTRS